MLFGGRTLNSNNQIQLPYSNTQMPSLYSQAFLLPSYKSGVQAAIALKAMGFHYVPGFSLNTTFVHPDSILINKQAGVVTLVWNSATMGIESLIGLSPVGQASQGDAIGSITSVFIEGNQSFMRLTPVNGSADFNTTLDVMIVAQSAITGAPDPELSDEIVVGAFWFFNQYSQSPQFATSPDLYCSVYITGRDASISPTATPISIVAPTSVIPQQNGSVNLVYPVTANNLGLLPNSYMGFTSITQGSITGIFNGYTISSDKCIINVVNQTGDFVTTSGIVVELDATQNGFSFALSNQIEINFYGIGYNIQNVSQLITVHKDAYDGIKEIRSRNGSMTGKFNAQLQYAYSMQVPNAVPLSQITSPDESGFKHIVNLQVPSLLQYPVNAMIVMASSMYMDANQQELPFYGLAGADAIIGITASSNSSTYPDINALNQLTNQGSTSIGVNTTPSCYLFRDVCTIQTISGIQDIEYRYQSCQSKIRWIEKNAVIRTEAILNLGNGQRANNNPDTLNLIQSSILELLNNGYQLGILGNTNNFVEVGLQPNDPTRIYENITTTIVPENGGADIVVTITPYQIEGI
jgi:hypothetical protein